MDGKGKTRSKPPTGRVCAAPDDVRDGHDAKEHDAGHDGGEVQEHQDPAPHAGGDRAGEDGGALRGAHEAVADEGDHEGAHDNLFPRIGGNINGIT